MQEKNQVNQTVWTVYYKKRTVKLLGVNMQMGVGHDIGSDARSQHKQVECMRVQKNKTS